MKLLAQLKEDASLSAFVAGIIVPLVGMTSSAVLVFQAARAAGADPGQASSWLGSLCVGMGILTIFLSVKYRAPVLIAWSTPGSALLVTGLLGVSLPEAIGAFIFSAVLIFLSGITGIFERLMNRIPMALASALLAGALLHFVVDSFLGFKTQPLLMGIMLLSYLFAKKSWPRSVMMIVLVSGIAVSSGLGLFHFEQVHLSPTLWQFTVPAFSPKVLLSLGIPLFIVTMASQNLTGITVMRANGYHTPISPLLSWSGFVNILTAPFGGFAINLAAITAAIAMGEECHPRPQKRYFAAVVSGVIYIFIGIFAATVTAVFAAFPSEMILGIAGLALLGTVANGLHRALANETEKDAAFITFALTASGLTMFGIGSAFWGVIAGIISQAILQMKRRKVK